VCGGQGENAGGALRTSRHSLLAAPAASTQSQGGRRHGSAHHSAPALPALPFVARAVTSARTGCPARGRGARGLQPQGAQAQHTQRVAVRARQAPRPPHLPQLRVPVSGRPRGPGLCMDVRKAPPAGLQPPWATGSSWAEARLYRLAQAAALGVSCQPDCVQAPQLALSQRAWVVCAHVRVGARVKTISEYILHTEPYHTIPSASTYYIPNYTIPYHQRVQRMYMYRSRPSARSWDWASWGRASTPSGGWRTSP